MLDLKNISVKVGHKKIIEKFSFSFKKGKVYAIMGPNGSGKSTLAYTLMGHPAYSLAAGKLYLEKTDITRLSPDKRANLGIFLSFQNPLGLSGVTVFQLLRLALSGKKDPLRVRQDVNHYAEDLKISPEILERSLNDGTSGGEKKKLEILQAALLEPKVVIFDEVDTGVDVDALKTIAGFIAKNKKNKTYILITHYNRILKYLRPDKVLVIVKGKLVKTGGYKLAEKIERDGYEKI